MSLEACSECGRPYPREMKSRERHAEILRLAKHLPVLNISEIARILGLSWSAVNHHLDGDCKCRT